MKKGLFFLLAGSLMLAWADGSPASAHRVSNDNYGVSGGNVKDRSKAFCCSGTLGSLVQTASGVQYILSNNHVLARSGAAAAGEDISQPGMIDLGCRIGEIVGDFTAAPKLGSSNVDAAVAALRSGAMRSDGAIQDIGTISSVVKAAAVGLSVGKSGRTTGWTTGAIGAVNASVNVQYQQGCGGGKKFLVSYKNQIVINSTTFSAGGDSGSLIVTNDTCHQPVGLLYAGSSSTTIANPVGEVLTQVGAALGSPVNFVGDSCSSVAPLAGPSESAVSQASASLDDHRPDLMRRGGVIGVGVGALDENPSEAAIVIYIDRTHGVVPDLPEHVGAFRVKRVFTDPFIALPVEVPCSQ